MAEGSSTPNENFFQGNVDEVSVSNSALTAADVRLRYTLARYSTTAFDQAGAPRPQGDAGDAGSLEREPGTNESNLSDVTAPGDNVVRVDGRNDGDADSGLPPANETVDHVIDDVTQKHLNFLDNDSGFVVTPSVGPTLVTGLRLYTANDEVPRDPASYKLEGRNADGSFTLIAEGDLSLPDERNGSGDVPVDQTLFHQEIRFPNTDAYTAYRLTFPTIKDNASANSMQIAEVEFLGVPVEPIVDPSDLNGDGVIDVTDIDLICSNLRSGDLRFDVNEDGALDFADFEHMVEVSVGTVFGDSNLDGTFNSADLVTIFIAAEYEDGTLGNSTWAEGDWNCGGDFGSSDLVFVFTKATYVSTSVPGLAQQRLVAATLNDRGETRPPRTQAAKVPVDIGEKVEVRAVELHAMQVDELFRLHQPLAFAANALHVAGDSIDDDLISEAI